MMLVELVLGFLLAHECVIAWSLAIGLVDTVAKFYL